jgi:hypothetical protein
MTGPPLPGWPCAPPAASCSAGGRPSGQAVSGGPDGCHAASLAATEGCGGVMGCSGAAAPLARRGGEGGLVCGRRALANSRQVRAPAAGMRASGSQARPSGNMPGRASHRLDCPHSVS